jgi:hypothetical protein
VNLHIHEFSAAIVKMIKARENTGQNSCRAAEFICTERIIFSIPGEKHGNGRSEWELKLN